jgi:hypothetical protein
MAREHGLQPLHLRVSIGEGELVVRRDGGIREVGVVHCRLAMVSAAPDG